MSRFIRKFQTTFFFIQFGTLYARHVVAQSDDAKLEKACPEAFAERKLLLAKMPGPKEVSIVSLPALRKELLEMERQDQAARAVFEEAINTAGGDIPMDDPARLAAVKVDAINLPKLKHIIAQDGFPKIAMVGLDGVHAAFLLTQHADSDPAFQAKMLTVISHRLHSGEIKGGQLALLTDRVLIAQGKKQRYGTQFTGQGDKLGPSPIEDEARVDQRRHALGIMSLAHYACIIHAL